MDAREIRGVEHGTDRVKEGVKHSFCNAILMRGVTDGLLMDDALQMAVLIDSRVDEFRTTISPEDFDVSIELGTKLIGILDDVVSGFGLVL